MNFRLLRTLSGRGDQNAEPERPRTSTAHELSSEYSLLSLFIKASETPNTGPQHTWISISPPSFNFCPIDITFFQPCRYSLANNHPVQTSSISQPRSHLIDRLYQTTPPTNGRQYKLGDFYFSRLRVLPLGTLTWLMLFKLGASFPSSMVQIFPLGFISTTIISALKIFLSSLSYFRAISL